jgi:predicted nucleic acid-binding protein
VADKYVLDTSAIFAYADGEPGADLVEKILTAGLKGKCQIYISFISLMELYYIARQEKSETIAKELVIMVKALPLQIVESYERLILSAGILKANHRLSLADAIIAATAIEQGAILVHKDPEMESLAPYLKIQQLPYKEKRK